MVAASIAANQARATSGSPGYAGGTVISTIEGSVQRLREWTGNQLQFGPKNSGLATNPTGQLALDQTGQPEHSVLPQWLLIGVLLVVGLWIVHRL